MGGRSAVIAAIKDVTGDGKIRRTRERKAKRMCAEVDNEGTLKGARAREEITTTVTKTRPSKRPRDVSETEAAELYPNYAVCWFVPSMRTTDFIAAKH